MYKVDKKTPLRIAPWDYDHGLGRDGDNELNLDDKPLRMERSVLFARLLKYDWYKNKLKKRWNYLNQTNLLSKAGLKKRIRKQISYVKQHIEANFKVWPVKSRWYYDENNYDQEVEVMLQFIERRHKRISTYFAEL